MMRRGISTTVAVVVIMIGTMGPTARASVHGGGVGACNYCHVMHAPEGSVPGDADHLLLNGGTASDVCLSCHADAYGAVLGVDALAPPPERGPGNFVFLIEDNINDGPDGTLNPIGGDAAGHNIDAPAHGLATDGTRAISPGGTYPAISMQCTSCHDPHGNGNYRFLWGSGASPGNDGSFPSNAPDATGLDLEVGGAESNLLHVAYRGDVSAWCGTCHGAYMDRHNRMVSGFRHFVDRTFSNRSISLYNVYNGTADPLGGNAATAYLAAVPFADPVNTTTTTGGPTFSSRVMCLSCHRAHASSAPASGRWDFNVTTLGQDGVVSGSYALPNPYGDPDQDPLCSKCHGNNH